MTYYTHLFISPIYYFISHNTVNWLISVIISSWLTKQKNSIVLIVASLVCQERKLTIPHLSLSVCQDRRERLTIPKIKHLMLWLNQPRSWYLSKIDVDRVPGNLSRLLDNCGRDHRYLSLCHILHFVECNMNPEHFLYKSFKCI